MNRPVTNTPASEARNSTVVSRGFSSCCSLFANGSSSFGDSGLLNKPKRSVPARDLHQVAHGIDEPGKFITWDRIRSFLPAHGPVNHQRPAYDVFLRHKAPIPAV